MTKAYICSILINKSKFKNEAEIFTIAKLTVLTTLCRTGFTMSVAFFQKKDANLGASTKKMNIPHVYYSVKMD